MWIREIESSVFFGSEDVVDHLSAVQQGFGGSKRPRLFFSEQIIKDSKIGRLKRTWYMSGVVSFFCFC